MAPRKRTIPKPVKTGSWDYWIGNERGIAKCLCCARIDITMLSCEFGHILAESCGGRETIENIKPICKDCNRSMGSQHMDEFITNCGFVPIDYRVEKKGVCCMCEVYKEKLAVCYDISVRFGELLKEYGISS